MCSYVLQVKTVRLLEYTVCMQFLKHLSNKHLNTFLLLAFRSVDCFGPWPVLVCPVRWPFVCPTSQPSWRLTLSRSDGKSRTGRSHGATAQNKLVNKIKSKPRQREKEVHTVMLSNHSSGRKRILRCFRLYISERWEVSFWRCVEESGTSISHSQMRLSTILSSDTTKQAESLYFILLHISVMVKQAWLFLVKKQTWLRQRPRHNAWRGTILKEKKKKSGSGKETDPKQK